MARGENGPVGLETKVGWVLSGCNFISHTPVLKVANEHSLKILDENVKNFWELERIRDQGNKKSMLV